MSAEIREPFASGRETYRLLFDFSILLSCMKDINNNRVLDIGGGSGWIAEFLNRAGFDVTTFDVSNGIAQCVEERLKADIRINSNFLKVEICDADRLQFAPDNYFGNIVCFDSLHHMKNFTLVLSEIFRVLVQGGRAIFSEPGAKHADSKETKEFMQKYKSTDPNWIERSIILDEINDLVLKIGFSSLRIRPFLLPQMVDYSFHDWKHFSQNKKGKDNYFRIFVSYNNDDRVIFYIDKLYRP